MQKFRKIFQHLLHSIALPIATAPSFSPLFMPLLPSYLLSYLVRFVVPSIICCRPFPKKHSASTCPVLHFNLTPSPLPASPPSLSHNPLACHTVQHVLSFNSGLWDTHSPTGASATAAAWELISMSSTSLGAFAISALCVAAEPPWRMCNAVFSMRFFFRFFFFAFYQLKATSKAESVCVPLTHTSTLKTDQNRQTHKQHTHTHIQSTHSQTHTHRNTHPHTRLFDAFSVVGLVCCTLLVLSLWRILSVSHCVWNLKTY